MENAYSWLLTQGPLGVGLVLCMLVIVQLWRRNEALQERIHALQEQRVSDARSYGERMDKLANSSIQAVRRLYRALGERDDGVDRE